MGAGAEVRGSRTGSRMGAGAEVRAGPGRGLFQRGFQNGFEDGFNNGSQDGFENGLQNAFEDGGQGIRTRKFSMVTASELRTSASMVSSSRSMRSIFSRICCIAASEQSDATSEPT